MLRVAVLGPVRAWSDGEPLPLGSKRQRTVFAVLVAADNRVVTHHELIAAVWGPTPPATARGNLYTYISGLRRSPALAEALESTPAGYTLRLEEGARDVDRFIALCAADDVARLGEGLRLWQGEAYAGLGGELLDLERAHLARRWLDATVRRAGLLLDQGDDGLVAELSELVRDHPLHEPLYELLMTALQQAGRSAEALEVFRTAHATLGRELGVEPGPALRAAHHRILAGPAEPGGYQPGSAITPGAGGLLGQAALLGAEFRVDALVAVSGRAPLEVIAELDEALADGVLIEAGDGLAFREPGRAAELRDSFPGRARERRRIAEVLAGLGVSATEVAEQLTAEPLTADPWILAWCLANLPALTGQVPLRAAGLALMVLRSGLADLGQRVFLLLAYVRSEFRGGGRPRGEVRQALGLVTDPGDRAELRQILATVDCRDGDPAAAVALLTEALADPRTPPIWRTRHRVLLTHLGGDDPTAGRQARWLASSIRRDHEQALREADHALELPELPVEVRLDLLDNRVFSLQNLDRLDEADRTLHEAELLGARHRIANPLAVTAVVQHFWTGRWDDAVALSSAVTDDAPTVGLLGMREQRAGVLLLHGVAALIAVYRGDQPRAAAHLRDAAAVTGAERDNADFLLVARALLTGRLDLFAPLLEPSAAPMLLRHQWLPDVVRAAMRAGAADVAAQAVVLCEAEAAAERTPARAAAALLRCRALQSGDPGPALEAADHYRKVGRVPELAAALQDADVLGAGTGAEAAALYRSLGRGRRFSGDRDSML